MSEFGICTSVISESKQNGKSLSKIHNIPTGCRSPAKIVTDNSKHIFLDSDLDKVNDIQIRTKRISKFNG